MPSKSKAQHNFMAMMAHGKNPKMRKVAYEFLAADKGKFSSKKKPKPKAKPKSKNPPGKTNAKKARKK